MNNLLLNQVTLPSTDISASVGFYRTMGFNQIVDAPHYARFEAGESTFSVHKVDVAAKGEGVVVYFEVDSVPEAVAQLQRAGLEMESDCQDQDWLWTEAYLRDPTGNRICIYHAGENRKNPPWRIN